MGAILNSPVNDVIGAAYWADEKQRWTEFYRDRLTAQLRTAGDLVGDGSPERLQPHFDSFVSLLNTTIGQPDLADLWLDLVDRLHPLPVRWGQWSTWLAILRQASQKAYELYRPAQQAEYLSYTADLLLNTGQSEQALTAAREAMRLARQSGAAWPLGVAGNAAAATLRSMARYDEAQALIDEVRFALTHLPTPQPTARAAMTEALLDLEQMDLLRYFKRLDDALDLGERLIANLSAVEGIDPHDLAGAYLRRATITWVSGNYQVAVDDLKQAAALYRQAGDELQDDFRRSQSGTGLLQHVAIPGG
ncbi:MAG: hypothetical protein R3C44_17465 [Chloroflexota bacterium]